MQSFTKDGYTYLLIPDEIGGYTAEILEFPGCFAEGETPNEAIQALERAAAAWIRAAQSQGQEIPLPLRNEGYGGKIALRLPKSLHRQAVQFAERDGVSLNQFLVSAIAARIGAEEFYSRLTTQALEKIQDRLLTIATQGMNTTPIHYQESLKRAATDAMQFPSSTPLQFKMITNASVNSAPAVIN